ncbi:ArsA family ATPase [Nodosilinea sp. P-1105]|uniref:ArsA family ATPase n=1 Tax=Nodosilinea sp. P-1105 TaxID=2546229 RepID=UPI00146DB86F|nr:ArsA family ATPase [Nodosilinea sp. P-1105]NMF84074.1 ArsA family ATPase [Nodosilinea sp. P-1105]
MATTGDIIEPQPWAALGLGRQQLIFVGGKGGVGKTTTAATLGLMAADQGCNCLVVSTDPAHSLGDIFGQSLGDRDRQLLPHLWGLEIDPEAEADRYIGTVKQNLRNWVKPHLYSEVDRQMDLTRLAPGTLEAALLERLSQLMDDGLQRYDRIIFDTAPTGHTLRLLSLPQLMAAWTDGLLSRRQRSADLGRMFRQVGDSQALLPEPPPQDWRTEQIRQILTERQRRFYRARRLLLDPTMTAFLLVLIPEKLPILESQKALAALRQGQIPVAALVINRVLPETASGDFFETRRHQEAAYLRQIQRDFRQLPHFQVPFFAKDVQGVEALRQITQYLAT